MHQFLHYHQRLQTDPKLAQEKWKLENLQTMSTAFQKWIIRRVDQLEVRLS